MISVTLTLKVFACVQTILHTTVLNVIYGLNYSARKVSLKADAVPTIFTFSVQPKKREEIAAKRKLLDDMLGSSLSFVCEELELNGHVYKEFKDASVQTDIASEFFIQPISDVERDNNIYIARQKRKKIAK